MTKNATDSEISELSFEEALAELEAIVRRLEEGRGELDGAIKSYERGAALKKHCEAKLQQARAKLEKIVVGDDGEASGVEPGSEPGKIE